MPEASNSKELNLKDTEQITGEEKCTSLTSETVIESADLLTIEKEDKIDMDLDSEDSTLLVSDRIEHTKMSNDVITKSGSGNIVDIEIIGSIQDNEIEAEDTLIKTAEQSTQREHSVEADTSVDHIETNVEEKE